MSSGSQSFGPTEPNERSPTVTTTRCGAHQVGWRSPTVDDNETASKQHGEESQTGIEVQCRAELGIQGPPV